ncbi:MAG: hypothetical protein JXA60_01810 [Candidatus Coatesbacteria bacterium]|nr:hypothetical protein [Candidatus Coatesbacteria bacterium]
MIIPINPEDFGLTKEAFDNLSQEEKDTLISEKFASIQYPKSTAGATCIVDASGIINQS